MKLLIDTEPYVFTAATLHASHALPLPSGDVE